MRAILALAFKDLQILIGVRSAIFFTFVWPLLVAILFGVVFSGPGEGSSKIRIALADEDGSLQSKEFISRLEKGGKFDILQTSQEKAATLVRQGKRTAGVVFPRGFGEALGRMFYGNPPKVEVLIDPSRKAESAMIEGLLFQQASEGMQKLFSDRGASRVMVRKALDDLNAAPGLAAPEREPVGRFLGELDKLLGSEPQQQPGAAGAPSWKPLEIENKETTLEWTGPHNAFDVTFPQGVIWGIIGCAMSFGIGIVTERTHGTLRRLQIAPITRAQLLAGKAVACFASIAVVQAGLFIVGRLAFKVRPASVSLLMLACFSVSVAFVGIMMLVSGLGKTEQAAAGAGWAVMLPMSLLGGGMVPLFIMPAWMMTASQVSPVKWAILALEGAIWRGFTLREMVLPCGVLITLGIVCFFIGTRTFRSDS
jgi:ABC-2 type transport system permease protein